MRHAAQILNSRAKLGRDPADYFARRGLLDGAVITYARCFASGRRTPEADIKSLLADLTPELSRTHDAVMWWRDKHVGHRVDQDLEQVDVRLLWGNFGASEPTVRTRVRTRVRPDNEAFEDNFEVLAETLAAGIWDRFLFPLQQQLLTDLGTDELVRLKAGAAPYREPQTSVGEITVAMDIGSRP